MKTIVNTQQDMVKFAENIASKTNVGDIILLNGDLGAGKTFFSNAFINYFNKIEGKKNISVVSPTFNIVKTYSTKNFDIYHFDLYRIKKTEELYELDLEDAFNNVSLIEWPNIILDLLPKQRTIDININIINDDKREIIISE
ncbi:MAG: tRNA (adenosine(37)-N6)-threonylcarbamoyltransferase complex ATPase subunit type 1 TsaE [Rickettsiales bacterium]|nr:tRNA (adenosine(37)-N6)-threonylcarbamoyltransferase complex ATPase subunit type 1 TsaE [Rickettsiales bacterium]